MKISKESLVISWTYSLHLEISYHPRYGRSINISIVAYVYAARSIPTEMQIHIGVCDVGDGESVWVSIEYIPSILREYELDIH